MISPRYVRRATLISCGGGNHFTDMQWFHRLTVAVCVSTSQNCGGGCLRVSEMGTEFLEAVNREISLVVCDTVQSGRYSLNTSRKNRISV